MDKELKTYQLFPIELSCVSANGSQYRLRYPSMSWTISPDIYFNTVVIEKFSPNDNIWIALPLRLSIMSRLLMFTAADGEWPPETAVVMGHDGTNLWFEYEDDLDEIPWGRAHSRWRATYENKCWHIKHLYYLKKI